MEKVNKRFIILVTLSFIAIISLLMINRVFFILDNKEYKIAVILDKQNALYNEFIKDGVNLAGYEMGITIEYIETDKDLNIALNEQIEDNSSGIIILEPNNKYIDIPKGLKKPVIFLGEDLDLEPNTELSYINSDSFKMGKYIAEEILKNGNIRKNIVFVTNNDLKKTEENMYKGFLDVMKFSYNDIKQIVFDKETIFEILKNNKNDVFVTFDPYILNELCEIKSKNIELDKKEIYGLSKGNERIRYLENDIAKAVIVKNEFSLGYLSVDIMRKMIEKKPYSNEKINFNIVNKRSMYLRENQYLLFPFK
ncbi:substrate-binding domain-containing protein [uncultured Tyzzerella sp.]|uniref:sugar ABC transporter substrate-binding protein n=1 Tax=uncultured Tyzzerella sp. TaxID=2321398 RepID=UPI002943CE30|nr:substrate-binding domain-containing protein [uncultured Tyzzerella sp.]